MVEMNDLAALPGGNNNDEAEAHILEAVLELKGTRGMPTSGLYRTARRSWRLRDKMA